MPAITYGLKGLAYFELHRPGRQPRPALRHLRRRRGEPAQRPGDDPGQPEGARRPDPRSPASTTTCGRWRTGNAPSSPSCRSRRPSSGPTWASPTLFGEAGYTTLERKWARPTCDVNGICGGYQGPGPRPSCPARPAPSSASASCPTRTPRRSAGSSGRTSQGLPARRDLRADRCTRRAGRPGRRRSPGVAPRPRGDRGRLRQAAGLHPRGGLDPGRRPAQDAPGRRHAPARLGPERRQPARPEREVLPGRLPPRHQGQRPPASPSWPRKSPADRRSVTLGRFHARPEVRSRTPEAVRHNCRNRNVPGDVLDGLDALVDAAGKRREALQSWRRSAAARTRSPSPPARRRTRRSGRS